MDGFLKFCKQSLSKLDCFKTIHFVFGNESCDLDSVVSAIVLAYVKYHELIDTNAKIHHENTLNESEKNDQISTIDQEIIVLPILSIDRQNLHLRSEITFWFEKVLQFETDWFICLDDLDFDAINSFKAEVFVSLVDHNENKTIENIFKNAKWDEIIDHHRKLSHDTTKFHELFDQSKIQIDENAGSCSSLVALRFFKAKLTQHRFKTSMDQESCDSQIALILYGPILLDTICFSNSAKRFNSSDNEAINKLENLMKYPFDNDSSIYDRNEVYQRLITAKNSTEGLAFSDLLRKDMKIVESISDTNLVICICSMTGILLTEMSLRDKLKDLKDFCNNPPKSKTFLRKSQSRVFTAIVLMSLDNRIENNLRRQLAIYCTNKHLIRTVSICLERSELELELISALESLRIYNQNNLSASRKVVLPIISTILNGPGHSTNNQEGSNDLTSSSAPSSFVQQPDSYYGSFIDDSFVGEFVGDYQDPNPLMMDQENILIMDPHHNNLLMMSPAENSCISHAHEIEFDFDSFGPESMIYAGNVDQKVSENAKKENIDITENNSDNSKEFNGQLSSCGVSIEQVEVKADGPLILTPTSEIEIDNQNNLNENESKIDNNLLVNPLEKNHTEFSRNTTLSRSQRKKLTPQIKIRDLNLEKNDSVKTNNESNEEIHDPLGVNDQKLAENIKTNHSQGLQKHHSMKKKLAVNYVVFLEHTKMDPSTPNGDQIINDHNDSVNLNDENGSLETEIPSANNDHPFISPLNGLDIKSIDLKIIEPYTKVISHGGHLSTPDFSVVNNDSVNQEVSEFSQPAIVLFIAHHLPDRSEPGYHHIMDNLFLYVVSTLYNMVADDYILIYMHDNTANNMPSFNWLKRCYQMIDRKLKKNLKGLFLVHPTFWLKTLIIMSKPFISRKFSKKLYFVRSLDDLKKMIPIDDDVLNTIANRCNQAEKPIETNEN
ncbi:testis-expressed sequence 2 protein-like [Sarcoptes scabiei]|nr:testis-expressed sequence 2 protein-like [Sarcoptes scabiei]